jgi:hypothetical protein
MSSAARTILLKEKNGDDESFTLQPVEQVVKVRARLYRIEACVMHPPFREGSRSRRRRVSLAGGLWALSKCTYAFFDPPDDGVLGSSAPPEEVQKAPRSIWPDQIKETQSGSYV